jgi:hypothetical protein
MAKQKRTAIQNASPVPATGTPSYPLSELHLDKANPRLGGHAADVKTETEILDLIVDVFGVDDVLSSIAVNGYFDAEPLIGVKDRNKPGIRIVEGNRRLAACLILAQDDRAKNQAKRIQEYQALQAKHAQSSITRIPVLVYDAKDFAKELLSYLGVRHIAASQPWDSFAKAAWVAMVLDHGDLTLADVSQMIGDQHRTVARLLEGYYFVKQLQDTGRFNPRDSHRRGRGSNPDYPFSWVYTALGYKPVRNWLKLDDLSEGQRKQPVKSKDLDDARDLMIFLFGNKTQGRLPAISDSRKIADLAIAVGDAERREMLKRGKTVEEVGELSKPVAERVSSGLYDAQEALRTVLVPLSQGEIDNNQGAQLERPSRKVRALATQVHKRILAIISGDESDADG